MPPSLWTHLRAAVDPWTRKYLGLYAAYPLTSDEYVGVYDAPNGVASCRDWLEAQGYRPQRLSAAKRHPETGELHVLSMRKVPDLHPFEPILDTELQEYDGRDCQYHVHAFPSATRSGLDVFSHYELRPFRHPREHYRPTYGETYLKGVTDLDL